MLAFLVTFLSLANLKAFAMTVNESLIQECETWPFVNNGIYPRLNPKIVGYSKLRPAPHFGEKARRKHAISAHFSTMVLKNLLEHRAHLSKSDLSERAFAQRLGASFLRGHV